MSTLTSRFVSLLATIQEIVDGQDCSCQLSMPRKFMLMTPPTNALGFFRNAIMFLQSKHVTTDTTCRFFSSLSTHLSVQRMPLASSFVEYFAQPGWRTWAKPVQKQETGNKWKQIDFFQATFWKAHTSRPLSKVNQQLGFKKKNEWKNLLYLSQRNAVACSLIHGGGTAHNTIEVGP